MGRQISASVRTKNLLEKRNYQMHRRISRAIINGNAHRERKVRDLKEKQLIESGFKYNKTQTHTKARSYVNDCNNSIVEDETNANFYSSEFYDSNMFEALNLLDHVLTHEIEKTETISYVTDKDITNREPMDMDNEIMNLNLKNLFFYFLLIIDTSIKFNLFQKFLTMSTMEVTQPETAATNVKTNNDAKKRKHEPPNEGFDIGIAAETGNDSQKINASMKGVSQIVNHPQPKKLNPVLGDRTNNQRKTNKPRYKYRKENYQNEQKFLVNDILFKLTKEEASKWHEEENLTESVANAININILEARLQGQRLYISPKDEDDHDKIIRQTAIPTFDVKTLFNKKIHFVLKELSFNDIEANPSIKEDLISLGVVKWAPLFDDGSEEANRDEKVRCKCRSRADLSNIMLKYFAHGKRYKTIQNYSVTATFHPDIANPIQCFKCFSFDGHMAHKCEKLVCGRCGAPNHDIDSCDSEKLCCANCSGKHEARDLRCHNYQEERTKLEELEAFHMTGEVLRNKELIDQKKPRGPRSWSITIILNSQK